MAERSEPNHPKWWLLSEKEVGHLLNADSRRGLSENEAQKRLKKFGYNQLIEQKKISPLVIFLNQFANFLIWILIVAAIIAGALNEWIDALAIIVIVILNALIGFFQEYRAERSLAALRKMVKPSSKVIREGRLHTIPSHLIVPGDLVLIEAGDHIPADGRMIQSFGLSVQEAALTGESMPIHKVAEKLGGEELSVGDKKNMVFLGTAALSGKGYMIVTSSGMQTELGKIASLLQQEGEEQTPLQLRLQTLGVRLVLLSLFIVLLVFVIGFLRGTPLIENLLISISLVVAAIPEGLPAIVTIALSIGVYKMAKRNALIRRLHCIETLGCTTVICTDKTGTLTQNVMTIGKVWVNNSFIEVTGIGYDIEGNFLIDHRLINPTDMPDLFVALKIGVLCNSAELQQNFAGVWNIIGDPTEGALLVLAAKAKLFKHDLEKENPLISEIPFDSDRKRMSTVRQTKEGHILFVKGAPDTILEHSQDIMVDGEIKSLSDEQKKMIWDANTNFAHQALRVLAVAYRPVPDNAKIDHSLEDKLIFVALFAMMDPPRPEAKKSLETCKEAGITTVMITGDHKDTAEAVAKELNLLNEDSIILTGAELDKIDDDHLKEILKKVAIYARSSALHKLRIVRAWKSLEEIVAMTGDGVNDAPALKEANIGIAMGITGTDVTKEASDMIISDDNFASIVNAVEEGRGIYDNITKFVSYLVASNMSEIIVVFIGMLIGFADLMGNPFVPLTAVQILWINLASDGLPAIALAFDPVDAKAMKRSPKKTNEALISSKKAFYLFLISFVIALGTLTACYIGLQHSAELAQTMAFTSLVLLELVAVQIIRSTYNVSFFTNPYLLISVTISFFLQCLIVYTPFLQRVFRTTPLYLSEWGIIVAIAFGVWALCQFINRFFMARM